MKTREYSTLGLKVGFEVPESVEEFDKNAGLVGACLVEGTNNIIYRGSLAEFRDVFLHGQAADAATGKVAIKGVEALSKIDRKTKKTGKKDKDGAEIEVYDESELDFFKRVLATTKQEASAYQDLANTVAKSIKFDAKATERKPVGPKKLAAKYKETAVALLKGPHVKRFSADVKKALNKDVPNPVFAEDGKTHTDGYIEQVGWIIKEFSDFQEKSRLAAMIGA